MRLAIVVLVVGVLVGGLIGCTGMSTLSIGQDSFHAGGSTEGIRAYNDGLSGLVSNSRIDPNLKSGYWQNREKETAVKVYQYKKGAK